MEGVVQMLGKLEITLENPENRKLSYNISSLFQGAMMEIINPKYAETLHHNGLKPYSQHIEFDNNEIKWTINTLSQEALNNIITPLLNDIDSVTLKHKNIIFNIIKKNELNTTYEQLINEKYNSKYSPYINIKFTTPTAFKSKGNYVFYPDLRLIYQSLINKLNDSSPIYKVQNEDVLEQLTNNSFITSYKLKSTKFNLEGIKINSFIGEITIKVNGVQELVNVANLLFKFGEYSGIGIKSAIGMGGVKIVTI